MGYFTGDVMVRREALRSAADELLAAALVGDGWEGALSGLAEAAGARGVALIRNRSRKLVSSMANAAIAEPLRDYASGKTPPNSRQTRVSHDALPGFRVDYDDYSAEQIAGDPFYQDFLRLHGMCWHANARLEFRGGEELAISFKRELRRGPYGRADARALDEILPEIRTAARTAQGVLDAQAAGMVQLLGLRGEAVFELDAWGRVLRAHGAAEPPDGGVLRLSRDRLLARHPAEQRALDRALQRAILPPRRPAVTRLSDAAQALFYLQVIPVKGSARDLFRSAAAVAVLLPGERRGTRADFLAVQEAFGLTDREADVASLLVQGVSPAGIAARLGVEVSTARFHLRGLFEKTGSRRQPELIALLSSIL